MACDGDCGNWRSLPKDIWGVILDKLVLPQDYIRFGAVCKLWQSIAQSEDQKQNRLSTITKVPPLLLIPTPDKSKHCRNLYSIFEQKVYNCRIEIPFGIWGFSSHGWWAAAQQDLSITLLNPFSKKTIHLPTIASSNLNAPFIYADPKIPETVIGKVVLSCNPSIYPSGFLVVVIYDLDQKLAFIRHGEQSWTYVEEDEEDRPCFKDALFYKGKLYAVKGNNKFVIFGSNGECEYFDGPYEELWRNGYDETSNRSYLVESSSGDLLLIRRLHRHTIALTRGQEWAKSVLKSTVDFKVYGMRRKMEGQPSTKQEDFEWIEIQRLDNDDIIFLGDSQTICVSASQFPNCRPNCIYFTDDCKQRDLRKRHKSQDMGFFDLGDRKIRNFFKLNRSLRQMPPATWIFATC